MADEQYRRYDAKKRELEAAARTEYNQVASDGSVPGVNTRTFSPMANRDVQHYVWAASNGVQCVTVVTHFYGRGAPQRSVQLTNVVIPSDLSLRLMKEVQSTPAEQS
jgi:hypothetical protein